MVGFGVQKMILITYNYEISFEFLNTLYKAWEWIVQLVERVFIL